MTTERYAELAQSTVNKHIRDWNERWFPQEAIAPTDETPERYPAFLL